jgi:hypothetical protein
VANKKQRTKRRVAAVQQEARRQAVVDKKARRQRLIVGGLALALVAPLTAGLIGVTIGGNSSTSTNPPPTFAPTTLPEPVELPWVADEFAGATITGPTPCPTADGTSERATEFEQAPPVCIDPDTSFELTFDTPAGAFSVPIDSGLDLDTANLAIVLARYRSYEKTPVTAVGSGLLTIGSLGDAGFTIPADPPEGPLDELYPIGSVVALADVDQTVSGSLSVVVDEVGQALLQATARHVVVGMIEDLSEIQAIYAAQEEGGPVLIDAVTVTETG